MSDLIQLGAKVKREREGEEEMGLKERCERKLDCNVVVLNEKLPISPLDFNFLSSWRGADMLSYAIKSSSFTL